MKRLEARKTELTSLLANAHEPPPLLASEHGRGLAAADRRLA